MWTYQRLLSGTGGYPQDEDDDDTVMPPKQRAPALQKYIAIVATAICLLQGWGVLSTMHSSGTITASTLSTSMTKPYGRDPRYMSLDHQYDHLWDWKNHTYIRISEPELDTGGQIPVAISMFHQLHCLSSMRSALQKGLEGEQIGLDFHDNAHWPHCLDYLRNSILCFADDTLELPIMYNETVRANIINGVKDPHQCRSAQALYDLGGMSWQEVNGRA